MNAISAHSQRKSNKKQNKKLSCDKIKVSLDSHKKKFN
jgi:hypothetical protein